jgi:hypothetical protein
MSEVKRRGSSRGRLYTLCILQVGEDIRNLAVSASFSAFPHITTLFIVLWHNVSASLVISGLSGGSGFQLRSILSAGKVSTAYGGKGLIFFVRG